MDVKNLGVEGFEWDDGNNVKNELKHRVETEECESVFYDDPRFLYDKKHLKNEERYVVYGITKEHFRCLTLIFTYRNNKIRIISARDQSRKEKKLYEKLKKTPTF